MLQNVNIFRSPDIAHDADRFLSSTPIPTSFLPYTKKPSTARRRIVTRTPVESIDDDRDEVRATHRSRIPKTVLLPATNNSLA